MLQQDKKNSNTSNMHLFFYNVLQPPFNKYFTHLNVNHNVGVFLAVFYITCEIPEKQDFLTPNFSSAELSLLKTKQT